MPDMLVKLYDLPDYKDTVMQLQKEGIEIKQAIAPEKHLVVNWVGKEFSDTWASECDVSFSRQPVSCFIATKNQQIIGFACYDATYKNFFGPTGVLENMRGKGIGKALLLISLDLMYKQGYGYAIIGSVGPTSFYERIVKAVEIKGSEPGIYRNMIKNQIGERAKE